MAEEDRNGEVTTQGECTDCTKQERSFDALARGLANGTISRRNALRLLGGALLGGAVASIPGVGWLAGSNGEAQAAPGDGPGGSTCAGNGQSCTAQQCCGGYTCLTDDTSGTEKFCCPDTLVCGQSCCPDGGICDPLDSKVCVCPNGGISCRSLTANPLTEGNRRIGECCDAVDELCCDGTCCDKQKCQTCALDTNGRLNCVTCATGGTCCPSSVAGVPGVCCNTATTTCLQTAAGPVCCPKARVCGNTCLAEACDLSKCQTCVVNADGSGQCVVCSAGGTCCQGTGGAAGVCCDTTNDPATNKPLNQCLNEPTTGAGICCPAARVCGNTCLATACDPSKCETCDATKGQCVVCATGGTCCRGTNGALGVCCNTANDPLTGKPLNQCLNEPTTGAGICCPAARVCGNTCLAAACDPSKCQTCDATKGQCVVCAAGGTCCQGTGGAVGVCCTTTVNGTTVAQCLNAPGGAGICCPKARVCGNTCLATACDPSKCQTCDPATGQCVSTCNAQEACFSGVCRCGNPATTTSPICSAASNQICCTTGQHKGTCKGGTGATCNGNGQCCSNNCSRAGRCT